MRFFFCKEKGEYIGNYIITSNEYQTCIVDIRTGVSSGYSLSKEKALELHKMYYPAKEDVKKREDSNLGSTIILEIKYYWEVYKESVRERYFL